VTPTVTLPQIITYPPSIQIIGNTGIYTYLIDTQTLEEAWVTVSLESFEVPDRFIATTDVTGLSTINFNITWDLRNVVVTGFNPYPSNESDRPRINFFRTDGNYVTYLSAGSAILYPPPPAAGTVQPAPWGNRSVGSSFLVIPISGSGTSGLTAGIDLFTPYNRIPTYMYPPSGDWVRIDNIPGQEINFKLYYDYAKYTDENNLQIIKIGYDNQPPGW
jgi:hypothetical protein